MQCLSRHWPAPRKAGVCCSAWPSAHPGRVGVQFKGQTVLVGVDDMDVFKGIELKLLALEQARCGFGPALQPAASSLPCQQ